MSIQDNWEHRAKKLEAEMTARGKRCLDLAKRVEEQGTEIQELRLCLHRICRDGAQAISNCEDEGADHYRGTDEETQWYAALRQLTDEARQGLGLSIESGE